MPPRAYSYLRFSSPRQSKGDSQRRQDAFIEQICREEKAVLDDSLTLEDLGVSAFRRKNAEEGALSVFLQAVESGRVCPGSLLIVEQLDRLSRAEVGFHLQLFLQLLRAGVVIITADPRRRYTFESINDVASILEALIHMCRAYEESRTKSVRIRAAWAQKKKRAAEAKTPISKQCPRWIELTPDGYRLIPRHAAAVRAIFTLALEGMGAARIANELAARPEEYPCFARKGRWGSVYVQLIISNPAACGAYQRHSRNDKGRRVPEGDPIPGYYPAAVSEAEWDAAQAAVQARSRNAGRPGTNEANLFTGLVFCARTEEKMQVRPKVQVSGKRDVYLEANRTYRGGKGGQSFPYPPFEAAVIRALGDLRARDVLPPEAKVDEREQRIQLLTSELVALDHRLRALEGQAADPRQDADLLPSLLAIIGRVAKQKAAKAKELRALKEEAVGGRTETLGEAQSLLRLLAEAPEGEKAALRRRVKARLRLLIESAWVLVQPINRQRRIVHVQIYLRGGRRVYRQVLPPHAPPGLVPWDLAGADFRAGDRGGVAGRFRSA
jgi:DNA invertase Pin-like site-specific DNA recombinase